MENQILHDAAAEAGMGECEEMDWLHDIFGTEAEAHQLTVMQVCLRAVVMFVAALAIVRAADKRFLAKKTAFDVILGFILASMLARAINGSERLLPTIAAGFVLAGLHRGVGWAARKWPAFSRMVKGHTVKIIQDGRVDEERMRQHRIGEDDLAEDLRLHGVQSLQDVRDATLERNGEISVIPKRVG